MYAYLKTKVLTKNCSSLLIFGFTFVIQPFFSLMFKMYWKNFVGFKIYSRIYTQTSFNFENNVNAAKLNKSTKFESYGR